MSLGFPTDVCSTFSKQLTFLYIFTPLKEKSNEISNEYYHQQRRGRQYSIVRRLNRFNKFFWVMSRRESTGAPQSWDSFTFAWCLSLFQTFNNTSFACMLVDASPRLTVFDSFHLRSLLSVLGGDLSWETPEEPRKQVTSSETRQEPARAASSLPSGGMPARIGVTISEKRCEKWLPEKILESLGPTHFRLLLYFCTVAAIMDERCMRNGTIQTDTLTQQHRRGLGITVRMRYHTKTATAYGALTAKVGHLSSLRHHFPSKPTAKLS